METVVKYNYLLYNNFIEDFLKFTYLEIVKSFFTSHLKINRAKAKLICFI